MDNLVWLLLVLTSGLNFNLDWAAFQGNADSSRVEFYYGIGYDQLHFLPVEDQLIAPFTISFAMKGLDNQFATAGSLRKRARIKSFREAMATRRTFVDQFSVLAPPGTYEITATIADSAGQGTLTDTIVVPDFSRGLSLSSVQLAAGLIADTITGGFGVVPNPGRRFGADGVKSVYAYFEGYGLKPDSGGYEISYQLLGANRKDTFFSAKPFRRRKSGTKTATTLELNIESLPSGSYIFLAQLTDLSNNQRVNTERSFTIGTEPTAVSSPYRFQPSPREEPYYREIQFLATPKELAYYNNLSDSGKTAYLAWFWSKHNLSEFVRRMETAQVRFKTARTPGVKTDRGRIYVKYGEPDAVERKTMEMDIKPREYWHYYQLGLTFIFIDLRGDGDYRLAWTNSPDEPSTGLESLLTPEEQNQYH